MNNLIRLCLTQSKSITYAASVTGLGLSIFVPSVSATPETAHSANDFVDSIGVNTHLYYDNSVYYQNYGDIIKPKLLELGIRHIRDGAVINNNGYYDRLKELGGLGITASLSADPRGVTVQQAVDIVKSLGNAVEGIEGPAEYDTSGDGNWVNTVCTYVQQLYQAVKSDSATASLPVVGPSFTSEAAANAVGDLSAFIDYGNMHNYYAGRNPGTGGWGDNGYGSLAWNVQVAQKQSSSKQVLSTETGYNNAINSTGNTPVPEAVAGKYIPRLFLEQFNYGIPRTWNYELIDAYNNSNAPTSNFGLLRNNGSEKPAYVALKNLISLVNDPGAKFTPGALDYTLSGGDTTTIHHTLLQKQDGTFYLILWQEVSGFDVDAKQSLDVSNQQVTLTLNQPIAQATIYLPNNSIDTVEQDANPNQINLNVPDYPIVVKLQT